MLSENQKKYIKVVAVLLVIVAVVLLLKNKEKVVNKPGDKTNQLPQESTKPINIEKKPAEEIPGELPKDLPFEADATLIRNEVLSSETTNEIQFARGYYSKKTVKQNYDIFKKYLTDSGWKILFDINQENSAMLGGTKTGVNGNLQITISKNSITGDITVQTVLSRQK